MNTVNRLIAALGRKRLTPALIPNIYPMAREAEEVVVDDLGGLKPVNNSEG